MLRCYSRIGLPSLCRLYNTGKYRPLREPSMHYSAYVVATPTYVEPDHEVVETKGWIRQGEDYAFDGHGVEHYGIDGVYTPTNVLVDRGNFLILGTSNRAIVYGPDQWTYCMSPQYPNKVDTAHGSFHFEKDSYYYHVVVGLGGQGGGRDYRTSTEVGIACFNPSKELIGTKTTWVNYIYCTYDSHPEMTPEEFTANITREILALDFHPWTTGSRKWSKEPAWDEGLWAMDVDRLAKAAKHNVRRSRLHSLVSSIAYESAMGSWASMAKDCCDGQRRFDGNALNWVSKLTSWGGEVSSTLALAGNLSDPKQWASSWLSFRFGSRLEYKTSTDILDAVWDQFLTIRTDTKYAGTYTSRSSKTSLLPWGSKLYMKMRLVCSNESLNRVMTGVKSIMDWGYWPSLVNTFDLIPFSFVADWLTNISAILDNVDDMVYRQYLMVELCERSIKCDVPITLAGNSGFFTANEDVKMTYYHRWGDRQLPAFGILEGWEPSLPSLVNFVDSVSLLVQLRG